MGEGKEERRQYINKNGKSCHVSPAIVEKFLGGVHYPSERYELIVNAQKKEAPDAVMELLIMLPNKTYTSPIDVTKEIGKLE